MNIRPEQPRDYREVENLVRESFWNVYRPGALEHYVLHRLRDDPAFVRELDFVMEKDGRIVGQNVFVRAKIRADDGRDVPILTMGPICIAPDLKRQGYGKKLLDFSLERATALGYGAVCFEEYRFRVSASKIAFDGFMLAYTEADEEKVKSNVMLKSIDENSKLILNEFEPTQHFTQPPAHYTEASLVKTLEELGIGRPSTYSPTITTIIARHYITKEQKNLYVTEIGEVVNSIMKESFSSIVDERFTANMEALLDNVAVGKIAWKTVIENFYPDLKKAVDEAEEQLEKVTIEDEVTDVVCEECGRNMVVKYGPHGKFLACPGFPECRNTKTYFEKIGVSCPKCGKDVVIKKTKKGRKYYGCIDNPECDFMSWGRPVNEKCPKCGGYMVVKGKKIACQDPQCGYIMDKPQEE